MLKNRYDDILKNVLILIYGYILIIFIELKVIWFVIL